MEPIKEKRYCPECLKEIVGRAGKMFCSDNCRNNYNNRLNKDSTNLVRNINNRLRKNYRILNELNVVENAKVDRKLLVKKGFDFEFFTNIFDAKTGNQYFFVYDQGYAEIEEDMFLLLKTED